MSALTAATHPAPTRLSPLPDLFRREPLFAGAALFLAALMAPTAFAFLIEQRTFQGINVWIKPLKFQFALAVYLATLAWFADWLPRGTTKTPGYRAYAAFVVFAILAEIVWVGGAAALGVGSHYNTAVRGLYPLMGFFAVVLTSASLVYGVLIWRDKESGLDPVFRLSVSISLILTFILTTIAASTLSSFASHYIGSGASDVRGFPIMGWSRDGGDLRVAHFFATHAMHVVPVVGLIASFALPKSLGRAAVILASIAYTAFVGFTFMQALQGRPFIVFGI
jgi:hypothetical protein